MLVALPKKESAYDNYDYKSKLNSNLFSYATMISLFLNKILQENYKKEEREKIK
jgi:hypothetical protein